MTTGDDKRVDGEASPRTSKRPYAKPQLQEYGSIAKLTQSGGSTSYEPGGGPAMKSCL